MQFNSINRMRLQSWSTRIDSRLRVAVPPGAASWKVGQRVFWLFRPDRPGSAVVSDSPRGTVRNGRYFPTKVERTRLRSQRRPVAKRAKSTTYLAVKGTVTPKMDRPLSIEEMKP
jgi:hypothetical protein